MTNFDYYYSNPTQNYYFSFNKLFSDDFKTLSVEAKALYALMLERANLSNKNNWLDDNQKVYIIYTASQVMDSLQCSERTALKLLKELDTFGLIERHRTKIGQPYLIYVKLIHNTDDKQKALPEKEQPKEKPEKDVLVDAAPVAEIEEPNSTMPKKPEPSDYTNDEEYRKARKAYLMARMDMAGQKDEPVTAAPTSTEPPAKNNVDTCKNCCCHLQNLQLSNINFSKINSSIYYSYPSYQSNKEIDVMDIDETDNTRNFIKNNIDYDYLIQDHHYNKGDIDNIVEIMTDVMTSNKKTIRIAGEERSTEVVKSVYSKLNMCDIQYVYDCLSENDSKIGNMIAYVRTALYNAKRTMGLYYANLVHYNTVRSYNES